MKRLMFITSMLLLSGFLGFIITHKMLEEESFTQQQDLEMGYSETYPEDIIKEESEEVFADLPPCHTCVYAEASDKLNSQGNVIFNVHLYKNGEITNTLEALSGRSHTQNKDRNIAGIEAPSPDGNYVIMPETKGYHSETGGVFIPYEPTFETQRSFLGFHIDPSWGLNNGEDGTEGCIAFKTMEEYNTLKQFINGNSVSSLIVEY